MSSDLFSTAVQRPIYRTAADGRGFAVPVVAASGEENHGGSTKHWEEAVFECCFEGKVEAMRRTWVPVVAVCLASTLVGSAASADDVDRARNATAKYVASPGTSSAPSFYWADSPIGNVGGVEFKVKRSENFIEVHVRDGSGLAVHGEIGADLDGIEQTSEMIAEFCGATDEPVELPDVESVQVIVRSGSCDGEPALATSGRVRVKLSSNQ
jgi:hypothetical protein